MKFVIDERVKHRLIGLVVILSIAIVFVPSMVKKSNHHFEENINLSVRLPAKPILPKVTVATRQELFHSVKVAKVVLPSVVEKSRVGQIAKAQPVRMASSLPAAPVMSQPKLIAKAVTINKLAANKAAMNKIALKRTLLPPKGLETTRFSIQLACFSNPMRAQNLVNQLRSKGYVANYNKVSGTQGNLYKVIVAAHNEHNKAKSLQKQLAMTMRLNGFIVKTKVS